MSKEKIIAVASDINLNLENMSDDDIKVTGKIESLDIERTLDEGD